MEDNVDKGITMIQQGLDLLIAYAPKFLGAIAVLLVGFWVIRMINRTIRRLMQKRDMDPSLRPFVRSLVSILLKVLLVISVMGMVGIQMTSFIAILGAAGLAVGMALSGTLQNFAGGVMILVFKPFKVGDFIEAQGHTGTVKEILIFNTILKTPDNKTIIIPNGGLSTGSMTNFSTEPTRRIEWVFGIGYGDKYKDAKELLMTFINEDDRILKEPEPFIALKELADSSVNLVVRVWASSADYWALYFEMNEKVYNSFEAKGLSIPFPQLDVHIQK